MLVSRKLLKYPFALRDFRVLSPSLCHIGLGGSVIAGCVQLSRVWKQSKPWVDWTLTAAVLLEITSWTLWNETCHTQQSCWLPVTSGNSWINWTSLTDRLETPSNLEHVHEARPLFAVSGMLVAVGCLPCSFLVAWWSCVRWLFSSSFFFFF